MMRTRGLRLVCSDPDPDPDPVVPDDSGSASVESDITSSSKVEEDLLSVRSWAWRCTASSVLLVRVVDVAAVGVVVVPVAVVSLYLVSLKEGRLVRNGMLSIWRTRRVTRILSFSFFALVVQVPRYKTSCLDIDIGLSIGYGAYGMYAERRKNATFYFFSKRHMYCMYVAHLSHEGKGGKKRNAGRSRKSHSIN